MHFDFVLGVGDNFYPRGIDFLHGKNDKRFNQTFEDVFIGDELKNMPFYLVAGNHDYEGDVEA